ncbi:MAG: hypothetical protein A4E60_02770 [Syntrophorhabdus sp. PtaB.Bin047]|nr:MAG: hypothetical protein A4E60_02770 [Syntrophorhabdus sp. PtaB.Bin047]
MCSVATRRCGTWGGAETTGLAMMGPGCCTRGVLYTRCHTFKRFERLRPKTGLRPRPETATGLKVFSGEKTATGRKSHVTSPKAKKIRFRVNNYVESRSPFAVFSLATCDLRPATCDLRPATCDLRPATCDLRPATCDLRPSFSLPQIRRRSLFEVALEFPFPVFFVPRTEALK